MLTLIRRNLKPFLLVITIVVCVAFGWFYVKYDTTTPGAPSAAGTIYGKEIGQHMLREMANHRAVAAELDLPGWQLLAQRDESWDVAVNYLAGVEILRHEAEELGLAVGEAEIEQYVRTIPAFLTNGQFDGAKFRLYAGTGPDDGLMVQRRGRFGQMETYGPLKLSRRGQTVEDLYEVVGDYLLLNKLRDLVGAGILASDYATERLMALQGQKATVERLAFSVEPHKEGIDLSEEEIKATYEAQKSSRFLIPERRIIEYVAIAAEEPAAEQAGEEPEPEPEPEAGAGEESEDGTEEEAPEPESPEKARQRAVLADKIYNALAQGGDFAALAAAQDLEFKTTQPLTAPELSEAFPGLNQFQAMINRLTRDAPLAPPVQDGTTWYIARLREMVEPEPKPLDEVREEIVESMTQAKAMEAAMDEARKKIEEARKAIEGGAGTLAEAVGDKDGARVETVRDLDLMSSRQHEDGGAILQAVGLAEPGTLVEEPVRGAENAWVVRLVERTLEKNPQAAMQVEARRMSAQMQRRQMVFLEWWNTRFIDADFRLATQEG